VGRTASALAARGAATGAGAAAGPALEATWGQLQHAFQHAADFGITGNASNATLGQFRGALQQFMSASGTQLSQGT
jgi:hypothetical protein